VITQNKLIDIADTRMLHAFWPFLAGGLSKLNETGVNGDGVTAETFLKVILRVLAYGPDFGRVTILVNRADKPLAFGVVFDNSERFGKKTALVYAAYSTGKCATAITELRQEAERWANSHGFEELHAVSLRINGATFRIFERLWGFRRSAVIFKKTL